MITCICSIISTLTTLYRIHFYGKVKTAWWRLRWLNWIEFGEQSLFAHLSQFRLNRRWSIHVLSMYPLLENLLFPYSAPAQLAHRPPNYIGSHLLLSQHSNSSTLIVESGSTCYRLSIITSGSSRPTIIHFLPMLVSCDLVSTNGGKKGINFLRRFFIWRNIFCAAFSAAFLDLFSLLAIPSSAGGGNLDYLTWSFDFYQRSFDVSSLENRFAFQKNPKQVSCLGNMDFWICFPSEPFRVGVEMGRGSKNITLCILCPTAAVVREGASRYIKSLSDMRKLCNFANTEILSLP